MTTTGSNNPKPLLCRLYNDQAPGYTVQMVQRNYRVAYGVRKWLHDTLGFAIRKTGFDQHFFVTLIGASQLIGEDGQAGVGQYTQSANVILLAATKSDELSVSQFQQEFELTALHEFYHMLCDFSEPLGPPGSGEVEDPAEAFAIATWEEMKGKKIDRSHWKKQQEECQSVGGHTRATNWILAALILAVLLIAGLANFASGGELAKYYDASHYQKEHAELGFHDTVQRMPVIYETDLWKDKSHIWKHYPERDMPDGDKWLKKIQVAQADAVLLDFESLDWNIYAKKEGKRITREERVQRLDYLADIVRLMKQRTSDSGTKGTRWFFYGTPVTPGQGLGERASLRKAASDWMVAEKPLHQEFDAFVQVCYLRWPSDTLEKYQERMNYTAELARRLGKPVYGIIRPGHPPLKPKLTRPLDAQVLVQHFRHCDSLLDGMILWEAPDKPWYIPTEHREELRKSRYLLLEMMDR